jgi:hypothetical protein
MADAPRLVSPHLAVTLDDGTVLDVQTANPDLVRYERTAARHKWPPATQAPMTWLTFLAWAALRREAQIPADLTWEAFADTRCLSVENLTGDDDDQDDDDDDDDEDGPGRPTPPGPDPG